jgi:iron complex outermembrane receptor protein
LRSRGEVRTVSPGVYENYGATRREGIEASLRWSPSELFELAAVYGLTQTRIEQNADARLLGLAVPGVPKHTATLEAALRPVAGLAIDATWRYVGAYQVDALNTQQASSYGLLDLGIAYVRAGEHRYRLYARLENALDRRYATSVSLIGGERLFAPGAPRVLRTGVQIDL